MINSKMKILRTYSQSYLAHLDLAKLSDEEIDAYLQDDNIVSINPVLAHAVGGIKLFVRDVDFNKAQKILECNEYDSLSVEYDKETIEPQFKCPECGGINLFQKGSWLFGLLILILFFVPLTKRKPEYICMDCSARWNDTLN